MNVIQTRNLSKSYRLRVKQDESARAAPTGGAVPAQGPDTRTGFFSRFRKTIRTVHAVQGVNLNVEAGEALAFLGPNGAGKSTTIKLLSGILHPDSGSAEVLGLVPWRDRKQLAFQVGSVFGQKSQLWYHLPPSDSFRLLGAIYEVEHRELGRRIGNLVERFDLGELMEIPVRKLSLGQRIRCEIAASLLHEPRILFLDEPTIGLDVVVKEEIRRLLLEWNQDRKVTLFLTSHDLGDVEKLCSRAVLIHHGAVVVDQSLRELKKTAGRYKILGLRYREPPAGGMATVLSAIGLRWEDQMAALTRPGFAEISGGAVKVIKTGVQAIKLKVDTRLVPIQQVLQNLVARGEVEDFTVEDEPLERLIGDLYRTSSKEEAHALANE